MIYTIKEVTDTFVYGRIVCDDTYPIEKACRKALKKETEIAEMGSDDDAYSDDTRKGKVAWLTKSKELRNDLDSFISEINLQYFNEDISDLAESYQVTIYDNPADNYDWHQDHYDDDPPDNFKRNLSVSVCLSASDFYEGAEFFIKDGSEQNVRVFKMKYGDFIIFPATTEHKVNALRNGKRLSLVMWYGTNTQYFTFKHVP